MNQPPVPPVQIVFAMESLATAASPWVMFTPLGRICEMARQAGYDGIEYFPIRFIPAWQVFFGQPSITTLPWILAAQQSFRSERNLVEVLNHPNTLAALLAFVMLPERELSLKHLLELQKLKAWPTLPLLINPHHEWLEEPQYELWPQLEVRLYQTAPELLGRWHIKTAAEFVEAVHDKHAHISLDTYHLRRAPTQGFTTRFEPWEEAFKAILRHARQIRLSFRADSKDSFDEVWDLYLGTTRFHTPLWDMIAMIAESEWQGQLVVQVASNVAKTVIKGNNLPVWPGELTSFHRRIVDNLRSAFRTPSAPAL